MPLCSPNLAMSIFLYRQPLQRAAPHRRGIAPALQSRIAKIAARILFPGSKLAISRGLGPETLTSTLAQECALPDDVDENHLHTAMDWILPRQARIEKPSPPDTSRKVPSCSAISSEAICVDRGESAIILSCPYFPRSGNTKKKSG